MVVTETSCARDPLQCIIPPYMLERLAESGYLDHPDLAQRARDSMLRSIETRAFREATRAAPQLLVSPSPDGGKHRLIYDAGGSFDLPGKLVRSEGDADTGDMAVREAYRHTGSVWNYFNTVHGRNSLDGLGMTLESCVHVGRNYSNAFWDGSRMGFGDGDGILFRRFTRSIEVVAHELAHGVIAFSGNLRYYGESGALNEHFGDVFGVLVHQWKRRQEARGADWTIGSDLLFKAATRRALRDMAAPGTAYRDDRSWATIPSLLIGTTATGAIRITAESTSTRESPTTPSTGRRSSWVATPGKRSGMSGTSRCSCSRPTAVSRTVPRSPSGKRLANMASAAAK